MMVSANGSKFKELESVEIGAFMEVVNAFETSLLSPNSPRFEYIEEAQKLHQWLIAPLETHLNGQKINNLIFVVDKRFRSLPFAALHDGQRFLIEKYSIAMMPGLSLTNVQYRDLNDVNILALGISQPTSVDRVLDELDSFGTSISSLPGVEQEINSIRDLWSGKFYLDEEATLEKIINRDENAKIIHIASNSILPRGREESYLLLWDQLLSTSRIVNIDFYSPTVVTVPSVDLVESTKEALFQFVQPSRHERGNQAYLCPEP